MQYVLCCAINIWSLSARRLSVMAFAQRNRHDVFGTEAVAADPEEFLIQSGARSLNYGADVRSVSETESSCPCFRRNGAVGRRALDWPPGTLRSGGGWVVTSFAFERQDLMLLRYRRNRPLQNTMHPCARVCVPRRRVC